MMPNIKISTENRITKWVPQNIRDLAAYRVPNSFGMIKLDAMENAYPLAGDLKEKWLAVLANIQVNRYPDSQSAMLKREIRKRFAVSDDCGLVLGNGSDELIQIIATMLGGQGRSIMAPIPTFSMYRQISIATATQFVGVPLKPDFSIDGDSLLTAISKYQPACVFLAYPNNPTANCFDSSVIDLVLERTPGLVIIDEAYFDFCGKSYLSKVMSRSNLFILRTLSKSGLAGLRLGMLFARPEWAEQIEKLRLPYNINSLTQASAEFFIQHYDFLKRQTESICNDRIRVYQALKSIPGIMVYPSETNFLMFRVTQGADLVFEALKQQGILVKNLNQPASALENCLRVTIGTESENDQFIKALELILDG